MYGEKLYNLIIANIEKILTSIKQDHVTEYDWLIQNLKEVATSDYQSKYRLYWGLNVARLSKDFYEAYFNALYDALKNPPSIKNLVLQLYNVSYTGKEPA